MAPHSDPESITLVGNAPPTGDMSALVDRRDRVFRLNRARGFGGAYGARVTDLVLVNCGGQMAEWLADPAFFGSAVVRAAPRILLPLHPDKDDLMEPPLVAHERTAPDAQNHAAAATGRLSRQGKTVTIFPPTVFWAGCRVIGYERPERGMAAPSTGLLTFLYLQQTFPRTRIDVVGFTFEGWGGHAWAREKAFFENAATDGSARLRGTGAHRPAAPVEDQAA